MLVSKWLLPRPQGSRDHTSPHMPREHVHTRGSCPHMPRIHAYICLGIMPAVANSSYLYLLLAVSDQIYIASSRKRVLTVIFLTCWSVSHCLQYWFCLLRWNFQPSHWKEQEMSEDLLMIWKQWEIQRDNCICNETPGCVNLKYLDEWDGVR